jgi:hypothetical protein
MATVEELQKAVRLAGETPRHNERIHFRDHAAFTTWSNYGYWFASIDGREGVGVGDSEEDVIAMAEAQIENGDD